MEVRLAATTPTAGDDAVVRILIAIELSKKSWIVGANTPLKAKTSQFQLAVGDWKALLAANIAGDAICIAGSDGPQLLVPAPIPRLPAPAMPRPAVPSRRNSTAADVQPM